MGLSILVFNLSQLKTQDLGEPEIRISRLQFRLYYLVTLSNSLSLSGPQFPFQCQMGTASA